MSDSQSLSRQLSVCTVMEAIVHCGPISRASIAKQTNLSKQTISEIARQLVLDGWIHEIGQTKGHVGRRAVTYEIVPTAAYIIAVDLGGTKVRAAVADLSCKILCELTEATDPQGGKAVVEQIARLCQEVCADNDVSYDKVRLVVVGVPGVPDDSGRVLLAPNIAEFDSFDVRQALQEHIDRDIILENDVNLAVLGEHWIGSGTGSTDLAYIALGTGIGSGLMVNGELVRGVGNAAGELGYLPFGADPFTEESLRVGALERVCATHGIQARYQALSGQVCTVPEIFDCAQQGDADALSVLDETARYLARSVATLCAVTNPSRVIVGGSIGRRPEMLERVQTLLPQCFPRPIELCASSLGAFAALAGGAAVGLSHLHATLFSAGVPGGEIALPPASMVSYPQSMKIGAGE